MKRTTLVLDEERLEAAARALGTRTWSETVNRSLDEVVRQQQIRELFALTGSGAWEGDLGEMRGDPPAPGRGPAPRRKRR